MFIVMWGVILLQMVMKCNDFEGIDLSTHLSAENRAVVHGCISWEEKKRAPNSSRDWNPHPSIQTMIQKTYRGHIVHNFFMNSGCGEEDAKRITA